MPLDRTEVEKIAHLARLTLREEEIPLYASKLSNVLTLIKEIDNADTGNIEPMAHPLEELTQRMRDDEVTETDERELFQSIAPETEAGLYLVPKVIE